MLKSEKYNVGVVVGRFQVHDLHPGHLELLNWVNDHHDTMIVAIGCAAVRSEKNPLPYSVVESMIRDAFPNAMVTPVMDQRSDEKWSSSLDSSIKNLIRPTATVCLYGSRDGFQSHYTGRYKAQELVASEPFWSGTKVREQIENRVLKSSDFRAGIVYGMSGDYPRVIPTVDAVVFTGPEKKSVYMVRKHGEDQFRFPGGYVEVGNGFIASARKEIREEVGDISVDDFRYLDDMDIDDWRMGGRDAIHTTVFTCVKQWGAIGRHTDTDEIAEVREFTLTNLFLGYEKSIVLEHHKIVLALRAQIGAAS